MSNDIKSLKAEIRSIAKSAINRPSMDEWSLADVQEQIAERMCRIRELKRQNHGNRNLQPA